MVNATPRPLYPLERDPVPIVQEAGWAQGPVWTGAEKFRPHRNSTTGRSSPLRVAIPTELSRPKDMEGTAEYDKHHKKTDNITSKQIQAFRMPHFNVPYTHKY
jgi:hypothetical protein